MLRKILSFAVIFALLSSGYPLHAQNAQDNKEIKTIEGEVTSLDWVGSTLVVRSFGQASYDEQTFYINDQTKISKGAEDWDFPDINVGDKVKVQYYNRQFNWPMAVAVEVEI